MSTKPFSLNEIVEPVTKLRKDQFRKIKLIVDTNAKFPQVALGLVKDYCKSIDAVKSVTFDSPENPKIITVWTPDTSYLFSLQPNRILETPTL